MPTKELDQTLVLIKPDALKLSLTGYVMSQLSEYHTGLRIASTKVVKVSKMLASEHYAEHQGKAFYPSLLEYIMGKIHYPEDESARRVKVIIYQGENAVSKIRSIAGPTNPHQAREQQPGCIRSLGTVVPLYNDKEEIIDNRIDNLVHASATNEEAEREIKLWLKPTDFPATVRIYPCKVCETQYYYKNNRIIPSYEQGSICILSPGNLAWESDLLALDAIQQGKPSSTSLECVVAKYLINDDRWD